MSIRYVGLLATGLFAGSVFAADNGYAMGDTEETDKVHWNAGIGLASLAYPSWRGSDEGNTLILPAPVFSIWTDHSEIGRGGIRAQFNLTERLLLRASFSGSLPANSDGSALRDGMPDLDPTLETGPALSWLSPRYGAWQWRAETLLRGVFTLNLRRPEWLGVTVQPRVSLFWTKGNPETENMWFARVAVGPIWASKKQHRYYYSVTAEQADANPLLRAYDAGGGYSGTRANVSFTWVHGKVSVSSYIGYDNLRGTAFEDSPLRPEADYWLAGAFLSWRFLGPTRPLDLED